MLRPRKITDTGGTRARLDGVQVAVRREADGAEADPFDNAMVAAVLGAAEALKGDLLTATAAKDPEIVHASIIAAVEGLLGCVRTLAREIIKVEIEGVETHLPGPG